MPAGYAATISCGGATPVPYTGGAFAVTSPSAGNATITCTITNRQQFSTVRVVKKWKGAPAATTIFVDQTGVAPFDASVVNPADGASASFDYPVATGAFVGETAVPAGYSATIDCGAGPQAYTGGPFAVTSPAQDGGILTCTITNTQQFSTVRVVKKWKGAPAATTIFVDQTGVAPFDASVVNPADGASASFDYQVATGATVGETAVPAGYSATIDCGAGSQAYAGGPFAVTSPAQNGGILTCTITNTQLLSKVRVIKNWSGPVAATTIFVDQTGVAPFDAQVVNPADGASTFFEYPVGTAATVGETVVPTGYTATIQCGGGAPVAYTGGPFAVTSPATAGDTLTCTISNNVIPPPATVRVIKQWDGAPASTTIFVDQNGTPPFDASTVANRRRGQHILRLRRRDTRHRRRDRSADRVRGHDSVRRRYCAALFWRAVPSNRSRRRNDADLHDHEQAAALDRADREAVGRRARVDDDLRRPGWSGPALRRLSRLDRGRDQRLLRLPDLDGNQRR